MLSLSSSAVATEVDSSSGEPSASGTGFLSPIDAGTRAYECDTWHQDCPAGRKCIPWSDDGAASWNATRCGPIDPDAVAVGETELLEEALQISERAGLSADQRADVEYQLGRALLYAGRDLDRALTLARKSRESWKAMGDAKGGVCRGRGGAHRGDRAGAGGRAATRSGLSYG